MYDYIIIGSGFAGAVVAQKMAEKGKKVLILEKRDHIGGNCYDENDEHGIVLLPYEITLLSNLKSKIMIWYQV